MSPNHRQLLSQAPRISWGRCFFWRSSVASSTSNFNSSLALLAALVLDHLPASIAGVGGNLAGTRKGVQLATVRALCRGAVQAEQALHNADLDDAEDRTALAATQFYITATTTPEQSTPAIPCGTTGIRPVSSSLNS